MIVPTTVGEEKVGTITTGVEIDVGVKVVARLVVGVETGTGITVTLVVEVVTPDVTEVPPC